MTVFVVPQAIGENGVRNLITDCVGMPDGYLFSGVEHVSSVAGKESDLCG